MLLAEVLFQYLQQILQQSTSTISSTTQQIRIKTAVLTLDDAIKSAISISDTLTLDEKKIAYQDKTNDLNEEQDDFNKVK